MPARVRVRSASPAQRREGKDIGDDRQDPFDGSTGGFDPDPCCGAPHLRPAPAGDDRGGDGPHHPDRRQARRARGRHASTSSTAICPASASSTPSPTAAASRPSRASRAEAWARRIEIMRATLPSKASRELDERSRAPVSASSSSRCPPAQQDDSPARRSRRGAWPTAPARARRTLGEPGQRGPALQQTSTEIELDFLPLLVDPHAPGLLRRPDLWREQGPRSAGR